MLAVHLHSGPDRFALDARRVVEVVPAVPLREAVGAPPSVAGVFDYRGRLVPVVDLSRYLGRGPSRRAYATRILLLDLGEEPVRAYDDRREADLLGLMAEGVVDLEEIAPGDAGAWTPPVDEAHRALGAVLPGAETTQVVDARALLDPALVADLVARARAAEEAP